MPHRFVRAVEPIVAHGLREMSVEGASLTHTLREVALMGAMVGSGVTPTQAIQRVEAHEAELLRTHPGEAVEPYHATPGAGMFGQPGMTPYGKGYGKGMTPYGGQTMTPYGKGMGYGSYGMGMTPGMGANPYTMSPYMGGAR